MEEYMSIIKLFSARKNPTDRFEQLVSPHVNSLYRFACRLCQNAEDAEELVQSLLTKLFIKFDELNQVESLRPWLFRSLYNLYVDSYRKQQRLLKVISPEEISDDMATPDKSPYEEAELTQYQSIIMRAIAQLNEQQRLVMLLHDAEGYTLTELSDILQTPLGTLKSRLHRARNHIKSITEMELFDDQGRVSN